MQTGSVLSLVLLTYTIQWNIRHIEMFVKQNRLVCPSLWLCGDTLLQEECWGRWMVFWKRGQSSTVTVHSPHRTLPHVREAGQSPPTWGAGKWGSVTNLCCLLGMWASWALCLLLWPGKIKFWCFDWGGWPTPRFHSLVLHDMKQSRAAATALSPATTT